MNSRIVWKKRIDQRYQVIENPINLSNLYVWLEDAAHLQETWPELLNRDDCKEIDGDMSYIIKRGTVAYIGDLSIGEYPDPEEFEISIVELIRLLEEFIALKKSQCPYIVLSEENGKYLLEGKDTLE